jgi:hypothetical protein
VLLAFFLVVVPAMALLEPGPGDLFEELRQALLPGAGGLLQIALEARGETPAIDFGLHARHCSAGGGWCYQPSTGFSERSFPEGVLDGNPTVGLIHWGEIAKSLVGSVFAGLYFLESLFRSQSRSGKGDGMKKQSHTPQVKRLLLNRETLRRLDLEKDDFLNREVLGGSGSLCEDTCITSRQVTCRPA